MQSLLAAVGTIKLGRTRPQLSAELCAVSMLEEARWGAARPLSTSAALRLAWGAAWLWGPKVWPAARLGGLWGTHSVLHVMRAGCDPRDCSGPPCRPDASMVGLGTGPESPESRVGGALWPPCRRQSWAARSHGFPPRLRPHNAWTPKECSLIRSC